LDNVTHSLFGYALGRAVCSPRSRTEPPTPLDRALVLTSVLASNAPDLDFITGFFGGDRRLIYLLEHRGLTHTLLLACAFGALIGFGCALALQLRTPHERRMLSLLGAAACLLHIGCDFLNDYGVHPLYPFDNRWFYGDSIFIVEPLWLQVLLPFPTFFAWSRATRILCGALSIGLIGLCWFVLPAMLGGLTSFWALALIAQHRLGPRAVPALVASVGVVGVFALTAHYARTELREALQTEAATERILDIASSPAPGDPSCHRALAITLDAQGTYRVRIAHVQLYGSAKPCQLLPADPTAPLTAADLGGNDRVRFQSVFRAPASELRSLANAKCDAAALLRFIRVPFWLQQPEGTVLGDLRYDRAPGLEFAERRLTGHCQGIGAFSRWVPPRSDLLAPQQ
jgi:inner membrane protein